MAKTSPSSADASTAGTAADPVIIKKYANRRLYNTETSSYITLDYIAQMTREGRHFQVFDAKSGEDITHSILTQIVMDEESTGQTMLPVPFLRQLIAMYGDSMQSMVPHYLEASMSAFTENQTKFRDAALKPFEHLTRQNMAFFETATAMLKGAKPRPASEAPAPNSTETELAKVKAELAVLQARLDGMGRP